MSKQKLLTVRGKLTPTADNPYWNISPAVGAFIYGLVVDLNLKTVLEVGTSNGYSGLWIVDALMQTGGHLYTVESHRERFELASRHFADAEVADFVTQIRGHAPEVFETFPNRPEQVDLAFFDATKFEYGAYLKAILPLLAEDGIILADNVRSHYQEMTNFIGEAEKLKAEYQILYRPDLGTGMVIITRRSQPLTGLLSSLSQTNWRQLID
jgi:predicted O-methyltransferase YrrM